MPSFNYDLNALPAAVMIYDRNEHLVAWNHSVALFYPVITPWLKAGTPLEECADDPALVQELLTLFGEELDGAVKAISRAIDRDDRETLRRAAHKLRGEAVTLDFRGLAQQLQVLESEAHTLETQQLAMLNAKLHKESRRLMAWLANHGVNVIHDS
ncbi:TPA: Hpt domain-containing protein [Enterobacter cloacae]